MGSASAESKPEEGNVFVITAEHIINTGLSVDLSTEGPQYEKALSRTVTLANDPEFQRLVYAAQTLINNDGLDSEAAIQKALSANQVANIYGHTIAADSSEVHAAFSAVRERLFPRSPSQAFVSE